MASRWGGQQVGIRRFDESDILILGMALPQNLRRGTSGSGQDFTHHGWLCGCLCGRRWKCGGSLSAGNLSTRRGLQQPAGKQQRNDPGAEFVGWPFHPSGPHVWRQHPCFTVLEAGRIQSVRWFCQPHRVDEPRFHDSPDCFCWCPGGCPRSPSGCMRCANNLAGGRIRQPPRAERFDQPDWLQLGMGSPQGLQRGPTGHE